jgi:hypothetical protein
MLMPGAREMYLLRITMKGLQTQGKGVNENKIFSNIRALSFPILYFIYQNLRKNKIYIQRTFIKI